MVYIGKYIKHYKVHYGTYGSLNTNYNAEKLKSYTGLSDVMLCSICLIYMKMEEILPIKTLKRDLAINRCKDIFLSS